MHWHYSLKPLFINLPDPVPTDFTYNTEYSFELLNANEQALEILYSFHFSAFINDGQSEFEYGGDILLRFDEIKEFEKFSNDPSSIPSAVKFDVMYATRQFFQSLGITFNVDSYV
ncbi:MAG: hypothetical protein RBG13Loki_2829 [Promethearchaeota archaeon CR_4]|nr:MAG: hypothetical protein RBG13Loki_2829 [Candidatus Lokiarchaeota archaeon CR_4]